MPARLVRRYQVLQAARANVPVHLCVRSLRHSRIARAGSRLGASCRAACGQRPHRTRWSLRSRAASIPQGPGHASTRSRCSDSRLLAPSRPARPRAASAIPTVPSGAARGGFCIFVSCGRTWPILGWLAHRFRRRLSSKPHAGTDNEDASTRYTPLRRALAHPSPLPLIGELCAV